MKTLNLANAIESINDQALEYAMVELCGGCVDDDSPEWEEHGDDILSLQTEIFDDNFNEYLQIEVMSLGFTAEQVVDYLRAHCHQRMSDIIGERYIDDWYDNFLENFSEETAE